MTGAPNCGECGKRMIPYYWGKLFGVVFVYCTDCHLSRSVPMADMVDTETRDWFERQFKE